MRYFIGVLLLLLGLICMVYRPSLSEQQLKARYFSASSHFLSISGGHRIHYKDEGTGPVVLMLHGAWTSLQTWDSWALRLARHYRVIRIDLPGHGLSESDEYLVATPPDPAHVLHEVTEGLFLDKFHLIAADIHATSALQYYEAHTSQVDKIALLLARPADSAAQQPPSLYRWLWAQEQPWLNRLTAKFAPRLLAREILQDFYGRAKYLAEPLLTYHTHLVQSHRGFPMVPLEAAQSKEALIERYRTIHDRENRYAINKQQTSAPIETAPQGPPPGLMVEAQATDEALLSVLLYLHQQPLPAWQPKRKADGLMLLASR